MKFILNNKFKLYLSFFTAFLFILVSSSLNAKIDYSKNESYYQNLCAKKSSFNANKQACQGYQDYLNDLKKYSEKSVDSIKSEIEKNKGDINKTIQLIQSISSLIDSKKQLIASTKQQLIVTKKEKIKLEDELISRLAMAQQTNTENFLIDFIMSSSNMDDFLLKLDGIDAMNSANNQIINDLKDQEKKLVEQEKAIKEEEKQLSDTKEVHDSLLKDYRSKEAQLFVNLEKERKAKAIINNQLSNLNIKDLEDELNNSKPSKPSNPDNNNNNGNGATTTNPPSQPDTTVLANPVQHATVTATAWYYPADFGGGWHPGIDLANNTGTPVVSPGKGVVLMSAHENGGYGNYMVTAHQVGNDSYTVLYGHLSSFASVGSTIQRGQTIAYMGSTGNSTGPHTHVEIFKHPNKTLSQVVNEYKKNYDIYFGLGYYGTSATNVQRLKPHVYWGLSYGQKY